MKNRHYGNAWKNIIILLQLLFSVLLLMSVFMVAALNGKHMIDMDNLTNQSYVDSSYYSYVYEQKVTELTNFLMTRKNFETNGEYDSEKPVNVIKYARSGIIRNDAEESYTMTLVRNGASAYWMYDDSSISNTEEYDGENDKAQFENYTLSDLVAWSKEGYVQYSDKIDEKYLPQSGISIAQGVQEGRLTEEEGQELYQALAKTLDRIGQEETAYRKALNEFDDSETNLSYVFIENEQVIYTNMLEDTEEDITSYVFGDKAHNLLDYGKEKGSYLYCNDKDLKFRSNVKGMEDYYYKYIDGTMSGIGNNAVFLVAVDTTFPNEDGFTKAKSEFMTLHPWGMISIVTIVVSLLGWIVTLVYLTLAAGRNHKDDKIHLNWIDHIKTEFFFLIFIVFSVLILVLSFSAASYEWDIPGMLVVVGVISFIYDGVFQIFYTSVIRRMKAGVFWEYSFTNWVYVSTLRVLGTWKASVRVIVTFVFNALLFLFLAYQFFTRRHLLGGILLALQIIVIGVIYLRDVVQKQEIMKGIRQITEGDLSYKIPLEHLHSDSRKLAEAVNSIGDSLHLVVEENTKNERMKADLITNVSHDIKTPLTSILNYVNLMKMEKPESERMQNYLNVLEEKSQRLRQLTEDLVEASRISSGNITLQMTRINFVELIYQTAGEFNEKFEAKDLTTITKLPKESVVIMADGRRIWRVVENLYNNVAKYAMAHTRVYVTMETSEQKVTFSIKNISEQPLHGSAAELTERFARGDESRTTEGSGLGLSIAQNLTTIMGGTFEVSLDGDLFSVTITFPLA